LAKKSVKITFRIIVTTNARAETMPNLIAARIIDKIEKLNAIRVRYIRT
jgi:hypothetical protein